MNYKDETIETLICFDGTKYIKGPFKVDGESYDYQMLDNGDVDYCDVNQMDAWHLEIKKINRVDGF